MVAECCGIGALSKLAIGPTGGTISRMDFNLFDGSGIVKVLSDGSMQAIRGTLDHIDTNAAEGLLHVRFRTSMWLTAAHMDILLPCLGFTEVSDVWTIGDSIADSTVVVGPAGAKEWTFTGCIPTDVVFSGQKGQNPILMDIGWVGKTYTTAAAGTFFTSQTSPAMVEGYIYPFGDGISNVATLTALGQTVHYPQFRLKVDFKTLVEFNNAVVATNICASDHVINMQTSALYSSCDSTEALIDTPMGGDTTGAALALDFQRTVNALSYRTKFQIANAKAVPRYPTLRKNDFNRLPLNFQAYSQVQSATLVASLIITNNSGV